MHELYNFFPSPIYALKYFVILGGCAKKHNIAILHVFLQETLTQLFRSGTLL